jgi:hypothetical protein
LLKEKRTKNEVRNLLLGNHRHHSLDVVWSKVVTRNNHWDYCDHSYFSIIASGVSRKVKRNSE